MTIEKTDHPSLIEQLAKQAHRGCGLSFELYSRRFQSSVNALLERLPGDKKETVIALAIKHDYVRDQSMKLGIQRTIGMTKPAIVLTALIPTTAQRDDAYHRGL